MGARKLNQSRWVLVLAGIAAMVLLAGCGRVDLEDLTPEAVKTQQAIDAANQPTPTNTPDPNVTPTAGGVPVPEGDAVAGGNIYNSQCSGCHEGGRAASIKGKVFDPAVEIPKLRSGEGFSAPHPKYELTSIRPLSDEDLTDIFVFLATQ